MSKGDFYQRKANATEWIIEKFNDDLNEAKPINPKIYYLKISLMFGFGQKFVDEILSNLIEQFGLIKEGNVYVRHEK